MSDVRAANRMRLAGLGPHSRRHAELLLWDFPLLVVSSAYRSPAKNKEVGGAADSFHVKRRAIDVVGSTYDLTRAAALAWQQRIGTRCTGPEEVLLEHLGTTRAHLHLAW